MATELDSMSCNFLDEERCCARQIEVWTHKKSEVLRSAYEKDVDHMLAAMLVTLTTMSVRESLALVNKLSGGK